MEQEDRIAETFRNGTVFVTGGSGFLGKLLVEKFLRCTQVSKIYLLVRSKKGKTPQERLSNIFSNVVFDLMKKQRPDFLEKCHVIPGDISREDLGISPEDRLLLQKEVEFIYHLAASTRFDDSVKTAVKFNTRSTKVLLDLARECQKLKIFVHVSTAYAFPKEKVLYEKRYKPPADPHRILAAIDSSTDEEMDKMMGDSPNTYTFSKALAEELVAEQINTLPVMITRPSVVCPTWKMPLPGWCNNLQGPMGLFVGAGKGIIRSMYMKGDTYADFIPADTVIDGLVLTTWNYLNVSKKDCILNFISSSEFNFSWEEIINIGKDIIYNEIPFNGMVWYPGGSIKKYRFVHNICFFLFQIIPALLIDALLIVLGYKPILYQIQRRIQKGSEMFEYYTNKAWNFSNIKAIEAREIMNDKEKKLYAVHADGFDVKEYFKTCLMCVRRNNLKETDDTISAAKRHMKIMWVVDIVCKLLFVVAILFYSYKFFIKPAFRF